MLEDASGDQPIGIGRIRRLRWRFVRQRKDARLAVRIAVELDIPAGFHIWIQTFAKAPTRFLPIHDRPAQSALLVISVEWREVMAVASSKLRMLLEQAFVHVKAKCFRLLVLNRRVELAKRVLVHGAV